MALKPGELRHKITFLKKTEVDGTYGKEDAWATVKSVRAKVTQPRTDESDSDHGTSRKVKLIIFIFYVANINEDNRLIYNGVEFDITSCRDLKGTRRELIIDAEKRS
jgi:SPP1 family predicted phage head-tail adaptor